MNPDENPVDYRDRQEVEACITFGIACVLVLGFAINILTLVSYAN